MEYDYRALFERLTKRYGGVTPKALESILCPVLIPIHTLDIKIHKVPGQNHYRASFTIKIDADCEELIAPGRTGKFVSKAYKDGGVWREIVKGRILSVNRQTGIAEGELYTGSASKKAVLEKALTILSQDDFLEVDQYGASAKVLSGLVEYSLVQVLKADGYRVRRMPEDMAKHIGDYTYFDFEVEKKGIRWRPH
jgi:hypothetical protein